MTETVAAARLAESFAKYAHVLWVPYAGAHAIQTLPQGSSPLRLLRGSLVHPQMFVSMMQSCGVETILTPLPCDPPASGCFGIEEFVDGGGVLESRGTSIRKEGNKASKASQPP